MKEFTESELFEAKKLVKVGVSRRALSEVLNISDWNARLLQNMLKEDLNFTANTYVEFKEDNKTNPIISQGIPKHKEIRTEGKPEIHRSSSKTVKGYVESKIHPTQQEIIKSNVDYTICLMGDFHYPWEDKSAIALVQAYLKDNPVDEIVFMGDLVDFYAVSKYIKDDRKVTFQDEIDYTQNRLAEWRILFPDAIIRYLGSNHGDRLSKFIAKNAAPLSSMNNLKEENVLQLERFRIDYVPSNEDLVIGDLVLTHGTIVRKGAGSSVRGEFERVGQSVAQGHVHRLSLSYKRTKQGIHALIETGCLCSLNVDYARFTDWAQGFVVVDFKGNTPTPYLMPIKAGRLTSPKGQVYTIG